MTSNNPSSKTLKIICPTCKTSNTAGANLCLKCGTPLIQQKPVSKAGQTAPSFAPLPNARPKIAYSPVKPWHKVVIFIVWLIAFGLIIRLTLQKGQVVAKPVEVADAKPQLTAATPEVPTPVPITTTNDEGQKVEFEIWPLYKNFPWVKGNYRRIENLGDIYKKGKDIFSPQLQEKIRQSPEVIVVGTADVRMKRDLRGEESLAGSRTRSLEWLANEIKGDAATIHAWTLGKWIAPTSQNVLYDDQRRVILIGMKRDDRNVEFKSALRKALESRKDEFPIFNQFLSSYSKSKDFDIR